MSQSAIAFSLIDFSGAPVTGASPTFSVYKQADGTSVTSPPISNVGSGLYSFNDTQASSVAESQCFVVDSGSGHLPRYLGGSLGDAVAFLLSSSAGTPTSGLHPSFSIYAALDGSAKTPPAILDLGSGLYAFQPSADDLSNGREFLISAPSGYFPSLISGTVSSSGSSGGGGSNFMIAFSTDGLIESVRRRALLPNSSDNLDDTSLLDLMTQELQGTIAPLLIKANEEYFVTIKDITVVPGQDTYQVPRRAVLAAPRDVQYADSTSPAPEDFFSLNRYEPETVNALAGFGFVFRDSAIVLTPTPTSSGTLRILYKRRPNNLVPVSAAGYITAINFTTRTVTLSSVPSTFTTSETYDFIKSDSPFRSLGDDLAVSSIVGNVLTLTNALPADLEVGDFIALAEQSPIPQCPSDLHPLLVLRTRYAALDSIGDPRADTVLKTTMLEEERQKARLTPRNEGRGRTIINVKGPGFYKGFKRFRGK